MTAGIQLPANRSYPMPLWMVSFTAMAVLLAAAPRGWGQETTPPQAVSAAVALVVSDTLKQLGTAFCVHKDGLFATTAGVAQSSEGLYLVLEPNTDRERKLRASVLRSDTDSGLALLTTNRQVDPLALADDAALGDAGAFLAAGFRMAAGGFVNDYPKLEVAKCRLASTGAERVAASEVPVEMALDPGLSGGPLLDGKGRVVAVLRSSGAAEAVKAAIPASKLAALIEQPQIVFTPPRLQLSRIHEPTRFTMEVNGRYSSARPQLELRLMTGAGPERRFPLGDGQGKRTIDAIPVPRALDILVRSRDGWIAGWVIDQTFRIGGGDYRLSSRGKFDWDNMEGRQQRGAVEGLESVVVDLGAAQTALDLSKADEIQLRPKEMRYEGLTLSYAIVATVGEREVARLSGPIAIEGLHPRAENAEAVDCQLPAPIFDLAVGGRGRWLILHFPALRKLAVFDVVAGRIVHRLPLAEERVAFAAGLSKLLVVFPAAGVVQRWDLRTGRREATERLLMEGAVVSITMGSGGSGPALVQWRPAGTGAFSRWSLLDVDSLAMSHLELTLGDSSQPTTAGLASTDGKAFLVPQQRGDDWQCLVLEKEPAIVRGSNKSPVFVGPDHRHLFTGQGVFRLDGTTVENAPQGAILIPATSGDYYLAASFRRAPSPGQPSIVEVSAHVLGNDRPLAPIPSIDFAGLQRAQNSVLTLAKRIQFVPEAKRVITIPAGDNRLVIHSFHVP